MKENQTTTPGRKAYEVKSAAITITADGVRRTPQVTPQRTI
jgi:hypothetical protein